MLHVEKNKICSIKAYFRENQIWTLNENYTNQLDSPENEDGGFYSTFLAF